ncbi:MAG: oxidoreductase [Flavobacteriales bacterium]|nr:oxidoreductase [Flavobacteriales bacterium]
MSQRIKLGMVGGGQGAFIGEVHRIASRIDDRFELVAGAFSSNPDKSLASGKELGLSEDRNYSNFEEMAEKEFAREDKIDAVAIVTPNHMHHPISMSFMNRGFNVICDKPLAMNIKECEELVRTQKEKDVIFALTHNYTGYPMIRQARAMCEQGDLGNIRVIQAEYAQDWLTLDLENQPDSGGNKQASWRTDPLQSGNGGCIGDIGTHAYNLLRFITQLQPHQISAELTSFVPGRRLDDNAQISLRLIGGAKATIWSSQIAPGNENHLQIRVYGEKAGLEWCQEDPNYLYFTKYGSPKQKITRGGAGAILAANEVSRVPPGHPEGYLEGFANIYSDVANALIDKKNNEFDINKYHYPTVEDGLEGIRFIERSIASNNSDSSWINF